MAILIPLSVLVVAIIIIILWRCRHKKAEIYDEESPGKEKTDSANVVLDEGGVIITLKDSNGQLMQS